MPNKDTTRNDSTEPNASADWRTEYAAQGVEPDLRADGGQYILPTVGGRACDRDNDGDELVVVEVREQTPAREAVIDESNDVTVADVNESFDAAAPVVDAVYVEELEAALGTWRSVEDVKDAVVFGAVASYSFPADRLEPVAGGADE